MKVFNNVNECWDAIDKCKNIQEVRELLEMFPRCTGEWWIDVTSENGIPCYEVTNQYWDGQLDDMFVDSSILEVPVEEDDL